MQRAWRAAILGGSALAGLALGCADPTREEAIADLGPEVDGVPPGPLHRPGQPCLTCHDGHQARRYSMAGTVFRLADAEAPAPAVRVEIVDSRQQRFVAETNCAGSFFVRPEDFTPVYPAWTSLSLGDYRIAMETPIHREGSCAGCHAEPAGPDAVGRVYLLAIDVTGQGEACPVRRGWWLLVASLSSSLACATREEGEPRLAADEAQFPLVLDGLEASCATLDCHGRVERNLRLWSSVGLRVAGDAVPGSGETTPEEYAQSYRSVVGLEPERTAEVIADWGQGPDRLTLVRKARGLEHHQGGAMAPADSAADRCLTSWLASAVDEAACEVAAAAMAPPPP